MQCAADCQQVPLEPLAGPVVRITDRQGEGGSAALVESLAEQVRLELLIDQVKPPLPSDWPEAQAGLPVPSHSLLLRPFRYPPLPSGSRSIDTALAEKAFHALRLLEGSPLPSGARIRRQQSAFEVELETERGLQLQERLSAEALTAITDPCRYGASQRCGDAMRERGVRAFVVASARLPEGAPNVGVLTPYAFRSTPYDVSDWTLEITAEAVTAVSFAGGIGGRFQRQRFLVDGRWPDPSLPR
jgi:hypothetical protein